MTFLLQCWFNGPRIKLLPLARSLIATEKPLLRSIKVRWPLQRKVTESEGNTMGCTKQRCSTLTTCTFCPSERLAPSPLPGLSTCSWLSKSFHASFLLQTLNFRGSPSIPHVFQPPKLAKFAPSSLGFNWHQVEVVLFWSEPFLPQDG